MPLFGVMLADGSACRIGLVRPDAWQEGSTMFQQQDNHRAAVMRLSAAAVRLSASIALYRDAYFAIAIVKCLILKFLAAPLLG